MQSSHDVRSTCDLTMAERVRLCGSRSDDAIIAWCERNSVRYHLRQVTGPSGPGARIGVRIYGGDVAKAIGSWDWSDGGEMQIYPASSSREQILRWIASAKSDAVAAYYARMLVRLEGASA